MCTFTITECDPQDHAPHRWAVFPPIQAPAQPRYRGAGAENGAGALRLLPASGVSGSSMLAAVTQQMARRRISALYILEGDPAVNSDRAITFGTLHAPPFTTREVAHDLHRLDCKLVEIVDHDVSPIAFDQRAAILETRTHRRMGAQAPVQLFQAHHVVFASDLDQCLGRVAPAGKELGVRTAVGDAKNRHRIRRDHLLQVVGANVARRRVKIGIEPVGARDIEHRVDRMFVLQRGDFANRHILVLLQPGLPAFQYDNVGVIVGYLSDVFLFTQRFAALRVGQLHEPVFDRAGGALVPCRHVVVEVPILEGECEADLHRGALSQDPDAALDATLEPFELMAEALGIAVIDGYGVVKNGTPGRQCQFLIMALGMRLLVAFITALVGHVSHLDETFVAFAQHAGKGKRGFIRHDIGDHRRAVIIGLHAMAAEPLRRPSARTVIHRLVNNAAHLLGLGLGGKASRFGAFKAHGPDHHWRERYERQHIDALWMAVDAIEELGISDPVPRHPGLHGFVRDCLGTRHRQHRAIAQIGLDWREAEAAIADYDRRDAVPARHRAVRVPEELGVIMGVQIDEAGRDVKSARVDHLFGLMRLKVAELGDLAVLDPDIGPVAWHPSAVDDRTASDDQIELRHYGPSKLILNAIAKRLPY